MTPADVPQGRKSRPWLQLPEAGPPGLNHAVLTGRLIDDPRPALNPVEEPVLLLEIEFPVADPEQPAELWTWANCQIEVLDALAQQHDIRKLVRGTPILVAGQFSNRWTSETGRTEKRDVIVATLIHPGPPPDDKAA